MTGENADQNLAKAKAFFERAQTVAWTNNYDYAIEMYIEGLRCAPDALKEGHLKLRELALARQVKGGKKPSMMEKVKLMRAKNPQDQLLNAAYLFAKDPDHLPYAETMLKAAIAGSYTKTANWIADLIFEANNSSDKPSFQTYILLKDSYLQLDMVERALTACRFATRLKPEDGELDEEFKRLSAELTVSRGKYDQEGDFRKAIKNRDEQEKLHSQEGVVKSDNYKVLAVSQAREMWAQNPSDSKNIYKLAEVLAETGTDECDNEAVQLLEKAYQEQRDFSYKQRAGQIRIDNIKRKIRLAKEKIEENTKDSQARALLNDLVKQLNSVELEHYRLSVENYPTDLQAKYDYAVRLIRNKRYDDAIPMLQDSQKDPRHKISSLSKIGLCFFGKGWYSDAIDIFLRAIDEHESNDDSMAKELRYNLARSYEEQGELDKSLDIYRRLAQLDFSYRDVRKRVDNLRTKKDKPTSQ